MVLVDASFPTKSIPDWVPEDVRRYIAHTEEGRSIRALARDAGCHASTILRQVRRCETRREDLLVDLALDRMTARQGLLRRRMVSDTQGSNEMTSCDTDTLPDMETINQEAPRLLRRLNEPGACLAIAKEMAKAVVVRENSVGNTIRTAVTERPIAEAMALKDWIALDGDGRVKRYRITAAGRIALKGFLAAQETRRAAHNQDGRATAAQGAQSEVGRGRYTATESPLLTLARRRDKAGKPFLSPELVAAGERLREDFELARIGPSVTQNWERFLSSDALAHATETDAGGCAAEVARARVASALSDLGPGLGDVILRCCCYLEGMEAVERRMGWSARSGKIVFRIALTRLKRHYDEALGNWSPMIG